MLSYVELTVVYPFSFYRRFFFFFYFFFYFIYLFILPYHVNMLISSKLPVKVDSIN